MKNLAGNKGCDADIERELTRCGIEIVRDQPRNDEVPSSLRGKLGPYTFDRAWNYWRVSGAMPLDVARELYSDPVGKNDVRVAGDCTCPAPDGPHVTWKTDDGRVVARAAEEAEFRKLIGKGHLPDSALNEFVFSDDPTSIGAKSYIMSYHIDTEVGLRLFADTLKKHQLA